MKTSLIAITVLAFGLSGGLAHAQPTERDLPLYPMTPPSPHVLEFDTQAVATLKVVHNAGADLYNNNDYAACYFMYIGSLTTIEPFLKHHPKIQQMIQRGRKEVEEMATDGVKVQAFELHQLIEKVRVELQENVKRMKQPAPSDLTPGNADAPKMKEKQPKNDVKIPKKPKSLPNPVAEAGIGTVMLGDKPAAMLKVTMVSLNLDTPKVYTTTTDQDGKFTMPEGITPAEYRVVFTGTNVPKQYTMTDTSPLTVTIKDGTNNVTFELKE